MNKYLLGDLMKIFNYNPGILDLNKYYTDIINAPQVDGIFANIILDGNLELNLFLPDFNRRIPLTEFLDTFRNYNKPIILNMLLGYQLLTDQTSLTIAQYNSVFVQKTVQLLGRYPNTFQLCAISTSTLYFLKQNPLPYKVGTIITRADLGFVDVDFYIFSEYFINVEFISSLLIRNKEVMIFPDATDVYNQLPENIRNQLTYIVTTPPPNRSQIN